MDTRKKCQNFRWGWSRIFKQSDRWGVKDARGGKEVKNLSLKGVKLLTGGVVVDRGGRTVEAESSRDRVVSLSAAGPLAPNCATSLVASCHRVTLAFGSPGSTTRENSRLECGTSARGSEGRGEHTQAPHPQA